MLVGNPDVFAIWCDAVDSWSTDHFKNGCFAYFIGGEVLWSSNSTLAIDLNLLSALYCIKHSVEDSRLFNLSIADAYAELTARAFPPMDSDVEDSDQKNLVSVGSLLDEGCYVFLVEFDEKAKLITGFRNKPNQIREYILKRGEFQQIVSHTIEKFEI